MRRLIIIAIMALCTGCICSTVSGEDGTTLIGCVEWDYATDAYNLGYENGHIDAVSQCNLEY